MIDCIDRNDVIDLIQNRGLYCDTQADKEYSLELIKQLKSIDVQPDWIPCGERLPQKYHAVLAYAPKYNNIFAVVLHEDGWHMWHPYAKDFYPDWSYGEIVAWTPLPEPPGIVRSFK